MFSLDDSRPTKEGYTNLFTFKSGGSSGYFSVCEKIKASWTAKEFEPQIYSHKESKNPELGSKEIKLSTQNKPVRLWWWGKDNNDSENR